MAAERLQKYLARAGVASRRHAEELITAGRVAVNNKTVTELGSRVEPGTDLVTVDGTLVTPPDESSYFLLYKPVGVVTTLSDPQGRPTVASYVEPTGKRLFPVGRLDYDAEGALLFTDDGALAHKLTHPSFQVPRTYLAKVKGTPDAATLGKLRGGVRLEDGMATPVSVGVFEEAERNTWLKIVVAEGRPHLIKRLCAAVGHPVVRLFRPSYAGVGVEGLRPGELRPLKASEVELLNAVADGKATPPSAELKLPPRRHGRAAPGFDDGDEAELSMDDDAPEAARPARKAPARAPKAVSEGGSGLARFGRARGAASEGKPARRTVGGDERGAPRGRAGGGRAFGEGAAPRGRSAGRAAGGEGGTGRAFGRGAASATAGRRAFGGDEGGAPRSRSAGRPERREWSADGEASSGRRGAGTGRPERREWSGGDESSSVRRGAGTGRPQRREWSGGGEASAGRRGPGAGRPERREWSAGGEASAGRRGPGAGRPERREWSAGGEASAGRRGPGAGRPERREWSGGDDRAPRGRGGSAAGAGRPERRTWGSGDGAAPRSRGAAARPERREWSAAGDSAPRARGPRAGTEGRPERREWSAGGASRPPRREWGAGSGAGSAPRGRSGPRREGPAGEGARPAGGRGASRSTWTPTDESGNPRERVVRAGARRGPSDEKPSGFQDWSKKKEQAGAPRWTNERPRGGAGRPPPRGPRRPH